MSIATTSLKYGWKVLAILTIGTGTIFVVPNVLNRITTKDRIEVILAVVERCLATQTGTNPATYGVDPPSIVRTWTDTNGASVIVTNAIAWRDDLSMKVELDAKLEALCPYYVDANSVYDGTTNIVMHTFTGLLTSLDLGDHTNFTAIPAIGTNAATYGPWAWRNYIVAWQERYKVLEVLKVTKGNIVRISIGKATQAPDNDEYWAGSNFTPFSVASAQAESKWATAAITTNTSSYYGKIFSVSMGSDVYEGSGYMAAIAVRSVVLSRIANTEISHKNDYYMTFSMTQSRRDYYGWSYPMRWFEPSPQLVFDANGSSFDTNGYNLVSSGAYGTNNPWTTSIGFSAIPNWCAPPVLTPSLLSSYQGCMENASEVITDWQFNYCTNKFW